MDGLGISESWTCKIAEIIVDAIRTYIPMSEARSDSGKRYPTISLSVRMVLERSTGNGKDINIVKL